MSAGGQLRARQVDRVARARHSLSIAHRDGDAGDMSSNFHLLALGGEFSNKRAGLCSKAALTHPAGRLPRHRRRRHLAAHLPSATCALDRMPSDRA